MSRRIGKVRVAATKSIPIPMVDEAEVTIEALRFLCEPNRLRILRILARHESCVCELIEHLGLQTMAHRHGISEKYRADITDMWWDRLDGTLPDPALFADLSGGACGAQE